MEHLQNILSTLEDNIKSFSDAQYLSLTDELMKVLKKFEMQDLLFDLYGTTVCEPRIGPFDEQKVMDTVDRILDMIEESKRTRRAQLIFCLYAYLFENYSLLEQDEIVRFIFLDKLQEYLIFDGGLEELLRLNKYELVKKWMMYMSKEKQ